MNTKSILLIAVGFAIAGAAAVTITSCKSPAPASTAESSGVEAVFKEAAKITFTARYEEPSREKSKPIIVSDPALVGYLVSLARFDAMGVGDNCLHPFQASFETPSGSIRMLFGHHCCAVADPSIPEDFKTTTKYYKMPKEFYAEFRNLAQKHGWRVERP